MLCGFVGTSRSFAGTSRGLRETSRGLRGDFADSSRFRRFRGDFAVTSRDFAAPSAREVPTNPHNIPVDLRSTLQKVLRSCFRGELLGTLIDIHENLLKMRSSTLGGDPCGVNYSIHSIFESSLISVWPPKPLVSTDLM